MNQGRVQRADVMLSCEQPKVPRAMFESSKTVQVRLSPF